MKEGYWLNYETDSVFPIDEHEQWIRRPGNSGRLGVPKDVMETALAGNEPGKDRNRFLLFLMEHAPIMRVRGHGATVTFEFHAVSEVKPRAMISRLGQQWFGPDMLINVFNFGAMRREQILWKDWPTPETGPRV